MSAKHRLLSALLGIALSVVAAAPFTTQLTDGDRSAITALAMSRSVARGTWHIVGWTTI